MDVYRAVVKFGDLKQGLLLLFIHLMLCKVVCVSICLCENILQRIISSIMNVTDGTCRAFIEYLSAGFVSSAREHSLLNIIQLFSRSR